MEEKKKYKPWEQQPDESDKAFEAFSIYRDMGADRSIRAVGRKLSKSGSILSRWSAKHDWVNRCRAFDADIEKIAHAKKKKLVADTKERQLKISYSLEKKALEALNLLQPEEMSPKDIKDMLRLAMEIQAKNLIDEPVVEDQQQTTLAESIITAYEKRLEDSGQ